MSREPVLTAGVVAGLVMAFLTMAVSLGWLALTEAQLQAVEQFVLPAAGLLLPVALALWARGRVTPVTDPHTAAGEPAVLLPKAQAQALGIAPPETGPQ